MDGRQSMSCAAIMVEFVYSLVALTLMVCVLVLLASAGMDPLFLFFFGSSVFIWYHVQPYSCAPFHAHPLTTLSTAALAFALAFTMVAARKAWVGWCEAQTGLSEYWASYGDVGACKTSHAEERRQLTIAALLPECTCRGFVTFLNGICVVAGVFLVFFKWDALWDAGCNPFKVRKDTERLAAQEAEEAAAAERAAVEKAARKAEKAEKAALEKAARAAAFARAKERMAAQGASC